MSKHKRKMPLICGHDKKKHLAKGLCFKCYHKQPHIKTLKKIRADKYRKTKAYKEYLTTLPARYASLKAKAKKYKYKFSISKKNYKELISRNCYYCEGYFPKSRTGGGLDRIDNSKGYTIKNVLPCCTVCNRSRNIYFTVDEFKLMINTLIKFRSKE